MIGGMALNRNFLLGLSGYTLFGIWFFLLACSQYLNSFFIIDNPLFRFLGNYSYPIYLFHFLFIWIYDKYIPSLSNNVVLNWIIKYVAIMVVVSVIAIPLVKWVEKPLEHVLKSLFTVS